MMNLVASQMDGMDELLRPYVVSCASDCAPTAEGSL